MLIVEDDASLRPLLERTFKRKGYHVHGAADGATAKQVLQKRQIDMVLLDMQLPDATGLELLTTIRDLDTDIAIVMMTAFPEVKLAVRAMREGASDFIVKPFELEELHLAIERVAENKALRQTVRRLERERSTHQERSDILGDSPAVRQLQERIRKVAPADTPVLVIGETGTGKELVADAIHNLSDRAGRPLIKVNCSAFSEQLLESELFGHRKGAFTGASESRAGLFEMADGGTLFLDEVGEIKQALQAKLLRVLEGHSFRRVGGQREVSTNVRIVAATNQDLEQAVAHGEFRRDLFFRLNVFRIDVPTLRDRRDDIGLLARHFVSQAATALRKSQPIMLSPKTEKVLTAYSWPGNIRELRNVMERAVILCETDTVEEEHLPRDLQLASVISSPSAWATSGAFPTLREVEDHYVRNVFEQTAGNISEAARILGISRNTLKARLRSS